MPEPKTRQRLDVLAYRCTPELLDDATVHVRELSPGVKSLWVMFERDYKNRMQRDEILAPHSIVTNALRGLTGGYVWFDPKVGFLATREPIDDDTLRDAFTLMCGLALGADIDCINLNSPARFAERFAEMPQEQRRLADYLLKSPGGQPQAGNWVFRTVAWDLSRRLAARTWPVDGREITFRPDSDGGVIAWDDPWSNKAGTAHALSRVRLTLKTLPNIGDPVLLVSPSVTRISSTMGYARRVLVEQAEAGRPVIEVEMAGRGRVRRINRMALETLARLGMDHSVLHSIQQRVEHEATAEEEARQSGQKRSATAHTTLTPVRPVQGKNFKFPVGRGVGMHYLRELDRHIHDVFETSADSPKIYLEAKGLKQIDPKDLLAKPHDVARSLTSMGYNHLQIVCLWHKDENRTRMVRGLCEAYGLDKHTVDPVEGLPIALYGDAISAVFHRVPAFLTHGPEGGRVAGIEHIGAFKPPADTLVGVWAETEYNANEEDAAEDEEQDPSGKPSEGEDAKHQGRRTLAELGVVSQYTADRRIGKKTTEDSKDHQVTLSLLDLCRSLGIIDPRIDNVMVDQIGPHPATRVAHVGIHVRRQSRQGKDRAAKICITAAVLRPPALEGQAWTLHGWSYTDPRWQPYHQAQTSFHASDYPTGKMTEFDDNNKGYKKVAERIDQALSDLAQYLDGVPYTVTVDGVATRRLWDGLHNNKQGEPPRPGTTWLPGSTCHPSDRPIAVIRVNKDMNEVPRPIRTTIVDAAGKSLRTYKTTNMLFKVEPDFGAPSWLLSTVPKQFDGAGAGRLGAENTRWTASHGSSDADNRSKNEVRPSWYTMTAIEIYPIPIHSDIPAEALAIAVSRLCHQPLAWSNRTRFPVPLHSAQQMDLDHPQYRRSAPYGEDVQHSTEASLDDEEQIDQ
jgi:hypothetical protein